MNKAKNIPTRFKIEIFSHPIIYSLLFLTLAIGLFIRIYRVDQILGFYFDQGRDALKIWDFWHKGDLFLVGPTTGIAGILRGPFYYYLIAPFYLLGGGNPVWPAVFLAIISMIAVTILFLLGAMIKDRITGLFAVILGSFSFQIMLASRWLSNPTPMLLLSVVLVWMMFLVSVGKKWAWVVIAFTLGLSLFHFGSAGELYYFFAIIFFAIWQRRNLPTRKIFLYSVLAFMFTALPQIIFDIKNHGILINNIKKFLIEDQSFKISFWEVIQQRFSFYYSVFSSKIFHWRRQREIFYLWAVSISFIVLLPSLLKNSKVKIILLLFLSPIIGLLFFQGNFGNIYDYYLTGYYLIFLLIFATTLGYLWKYKLGKLFVLIFFYVFLTWNWDVIKYNLSSRVYGSDTVVFGNQKQALGWIYADSQDKDFNVDVYVPPVIPYAYDYLFRWYSQTNHKKLPEEHLTKLLYTVYESDPPHPERLNVWLDRQQTIGKVESEISFGGITVQRRIRI